VLAQTTITENGVVNERMREQKERKKNNMESK